AGGWAVSRAASGVFEVASDDSADQPRTGLRGRLAALDRPLTSYYLLLGCTGMLLAIGLVMVLSTSSAAQLYVGQSPYSVFLKQLLGALLGVAAMWLLSKAPARLFRALATPMLIAAIGGLLVVLAFGPTVAGAKRWIVVAGLTIQPSEFAKLAFLLWGANILARRAKLGQLTDPRKLLMPLLPGGAFVAMLVMLGDDLGTTFLLLVILLALLWVVGTPGRVFTGILGMIVFALLVMIIVAPYRFERLTGYLGPAGNPLGANMQGIQGKWAIGSGGVFGVGLGESRQKWGWVPNASTDFIFAILGEELGLVGTVSVVLLYGGFGYAGLRVARRMTDPFMRLAAAAATAWIVVQALVNIGAVIGLLPITGVPLPLISQGLSSLIASLTAIGMLLSFARREPGAREVLAAAGPSIGARIAGALGLGGLGARLERWGEAEPAAGGIWGFGRDRAGRDRAGRDRPAPGPRRTGSGRTGPYRSDPYRSDPYRSDPYRSGPHRAGPVGPPRVPRRGRAAGGAAPRDRVPGRSVPHPAAPRRTVPGEAPGQQAQRRGRPGPRDAGGRPGQAMGPDRLKEV
ncbi:MAG: putative lipid II flippase FtsW, partial [Streptosporangiaceae bacterium]